MNKQTLLDIINHYQKVTPKEVEELEGVVKNYPYIQIAHTLIAKAKKDQKSPDASQKLKLAALYSTDRGVLKKVVENRILVSKPLSTQGKAPARPQTPSKPPPKKVVSEKKAPPPPPKTKIEPIKSQEVLDKLYLEIAKNLQDVKKYRDEYLTKEKEIDSKKETKDTPPDSEKKNLSEADLLTPHSGQILDEIKDIKQKKTPDPKIKEQYDIIEQFIQSESQVIQQPTSTEEGSEIKDLSQKSVEFNDELVSENLANILLKQGKKDKAIDIYKKLIWKFPQKKTYFAALIDKLKNQ